MEHSVPHPPQTTPALATGARRSLVYLLLALILAALAGVLTFRYLEDLRAAALPTAQVLVARRDIRPGEVIDAGAVEVRPVPHNVIPEGALRQPAEAVGRTAVVPIAAGEVLLPAKVTTGGTLAARLPDGRWAMVLPAGWLASPLPELAAGDRIDLLAYQPGQPPEEAGLLVSDVEVLQVGGEGSPDRLTLAVTLEEAVQVLYARSNGFALLGLLRAHGG